MSDVGRAIGHADIEDNVPLLAAMGDLTRMALVLRLGQDGPHSISQLAGNTPLSRQAITKHLLVLEAAGLVHSTRRGRERIWHVEARRLDEARRFLDHVAGHWDAALVRRKNFIQE